MTFIRPYLRAWKYWRYILKQITLFYALGTLCVQEIEFFQIKFDISDAWFKQVNSYQQDLNIVTIPQNAKSYGQS